MGLDNLVYPYTIDTSKRDTDFTGFSFNGFHSSDLGLVRVSSSDRYEDTFGPQFTDKTVQAPAANRTYYFGTDYTQKPFTLNVAFDELTEERLRAVRQIFNAKSVGPLIFDEWPYKVYSAKVQSPPQFKYICFDHDYTKEVLSYAEEVVRIDNTTNYIKLKHLPITRSGKVLHNTESTKIVSDNKIATIELTKEQWSGYNSLSAYYDENLISPLEYSVAKMITKPQTNKIQVAFKTENYNSKEIKFNISYFAADSFNGELILSKVEKNLPTDSELQKIAVTLNKASIVEAADGTATLNWVASGVNDKWSPHYVKISYYYYTHSYRIYKGEATIPFVCYYPFARSRFKYLDSYAQQGVDSTSWAAASRMLATRGSYDQNTFYATTQGVDSGKKQVKNFIHLYNPSDMEVDAKFLFRFYEPVARGVKSIVLTDTEPTQYVTSGEEAINILGAINFDPADIFATSAMEGRIDGDEYVCIDTAKNLIYGCNKEKAPTGSLYNKFMKSGNFFKIPMTSKEGTVLSGTEEHTYANKNYYLVITATVDTIDSTETNLQKGGRGLVNALPTTADGDSVDDKEYDAYIEFYYYLYY